MNKSRTGIALVLVLIVTAELMVKNGLHPLQLLGAAATGEVELKDLP